MQTSNAPAKIPTPWASNAGTYSAAPPTTSQIGIIAGAPSWPDGFVPLNEALASAGGVPPPMDVTNGALNAISGGLQYLQGGGALYFDASFSNQIGGYPSGCILQSATSQLVFWQSQIDNNSGNPDQNSANWRRLVLTNFNVAPVAVTGSGGTPLTPGFSENVIVQSFTAPCAGSCLVSASINLSGPLPSGAGIRVQLSNSINSTQSSDTTQVPQFHAIVVPFTAAQAGSFYLNVSGTGTYPSPGYNFTPRLSFVFVPTP